MEEIHKGLDRIAVMAPDDPDRSDLEEDIMLQLMDYRVSAITISEKKEVAIAYLRAITLMPNLFGRGHEMLYQDVKEEFLARNYRSSFTQF